MASVPFSTLDFAEKLKAGGFSEPQAKAASEALAAVTAQLVTRHDLEVQLQLLEQRLTIKLGSVAVLAVGPVATLVRLL
jgi:hypothetical protein